MENLVASEVIAERLARIEERVAQACRRSDRDPSAITLIGVTKTFSPEVVQAAREAGLRHFGENRVQELVQKTAAVPGRQRGGDIFWHMIGHLQRNKAKDIVAEADYFHALDSSRLAGELNKRAEQQGRVIPCLVQVNVSGEQSKFGVDPERLHALLDELASFEHIQIQGLMAIATFADDPESVRPEFQRLRRLSESYNRVGRSHVKLSSLSMGMSGDFEVAIEEGATHVRIGSAIFGEREP